MTQAPTIPYVLEGLDRERLRSALDHGVDDHGDPIVPFADPDGGWPLRCCLTDSAPGDLIAVIGWSPFAWSSPWRTTGPVVVHVDPCATPLPVEVPEVFEQRDQILRAYGHDHRLVYDLNCHVSAGTGLARRIGDLLADPRVELVQSCNVLAGCYSFTARRAGG